MKLSKKEIMLNRLTDRQKTLVNLYTKAYGNAVIWKKNSGLRVLDPSEVFIIY